MILICNHKIVQPYRETQQTWKKKKIKKVAIQFFFFSQIIFCFSVFAYLCFWHLKTSHHPCWTSLCAAVIIGLGLGPWPLTPDLTAARWIHVRAPSADKERRLVVKESVASREPQPDERRSIKTPTSLQCVVCVCGEQTEIIINFSRLLSDSRLRVVCVCVWFH